ncbi:hypothetical protein P5Y53_17230 [Dyella jiangningensis]|uniref:hypothetical protein n=1 Tax=Dyella jiangningensis TaxID=1379159 RepID=UPI00240EC4BC|nr:hypothetical protein [Dyella jiangningensis]MDG2539423.1 hypothetical protein [Dyella jiangningensis]
MNKSLSAGLCLLLLCPVSAMAEGPFDGTWKVDMSKVQMPKKPDVLVLKDGMYDCTTCVPPISVKADGQDHPVTGHPYYDAMAVQIVDAHTVKETDKKGGKVVATSTTTVAPDGKSARVEFSDSSNSSGAPVTGSAELKQVAAGPAGSHALSGSWITATMGEMSDNATQITFKEEGGMMSMSSPTGQSYQAKMDGTEAPYKGDPGISTVTVKKAGRNSMVETDKRDGKVIAVLTSTVSADGKTMHVLFDDKLRNRTMSFEAEKQ